jgi:NTP pyrophosphatase (non-canonical NTP hydrolase)
MKDLESLKMRLRDFAAAREWDQFHSPKNLSMALIVEAAELVEHFQWLTEDQSRSLEPTQLEQVQEELADIQIYLIRIADKLNVDLIEAVEKKIEANAKKYPPEKVRGSSKKYTEYK